ncbi:MAG: hypothetical protein JWO67_2354 [Streptosporangiaceae bacterium]|jgi:hypothetical protein|nr:hypothetical protein [Streptosporangiaceae bacterium]
MDLHERGERLPSALRQLFFDGGARRRLSVALPPGDVVWPDPDYVQHQTPVRPAYWLSDEPASGGLWGRLRAEHPRSGLWPVLLDDTTQPWSAGQVAPEQVADIGTYLPAAFMREVWADWVEPQDDGDDGDDDFEDLAPFGRDCPGLAPAGERMEDPDVVADWCARVLDNGSTPLGLAAVGRSADTLAVMGWQGALNHNKWTAPLAAVVRSWEDRFGVRVVRLGFDTLDMSVAAPPMSHDHALRVAAEHWAFCPDNIVQGAGTLAGYAEEIRGKNAWSFWWD